jgi:hypothetical protein
MTQVDCPRLLHVDLLRASRASVGQEIGKVAVLWRGDRQARDTATTESSRFVRIFEALARRNIHAEPAVYADDMADEVRRQLLGVDGILVWVDPISDGQTRDCLDPMLRDVAAEGVWVSAHPDVIVKMGVKEVLYQTRDLGWGTDTHVYRSSASFRKEFPPRLKEWGPRVIKRNRGNGGQGVWKVELLSEPQAGTRLRVLQARRGSTPEDIPFDAFMARCEEYFRNDGCVIDQPFQPRLPEGMIRCYMGGDRVVGFGHQLIKGLIAPPADPGPRVMHPASAPQFQRLRAVMEGEWTPRLAERLDIDRRSLPIIWDADFLYGPRTAAGEDTYVLCEINVSSVFPIPDQAPDEIARQVEARLTEGGRQAR